MSFSYSGDPASSSKDAVRFLLSDTVNDPARQAELKDEEILWILTMEEDPWFAAAACADAIAGRYAKEPSSKTLGETSISYGDMSRKWRGTAERLRTTGRLMITWVAWLDTTVTDEFPPATPLTNVPEAGL